MSPTPRVLSDDERLDWLRLARSENVGPVTFLELLRRFGMAGPALAALPELARRGGRDKAIRLCSKAEAQRELEQSARLGARLVAFIEPDYPRRLAEIADPPPLIALKGAAHLVQDKVIAIVGARNASAAGLKLTQRIAAELGQAGYVVVSGLARGIDSAAHRAALATGTAAVLAGGIDVVYPPENVDLMAQIAAQGALIAEMPPGTQTTNRHFPRRNRIIAGLAQGVLVVEAAHRSGSLITARFALEYGREVFAVPGSPLDPRCQGTNNLLRQGAVLTEGASDIVEALRTLRPAREPPLIPLEAPPAPPPDERELDAGRKAIVNLLGATPVGVDELIRLAQLTPAVVATILLELELAGRLDRQPGNQVALIDLSGPDSASSS